MSTRTTEQELRDCLEKLVDRIGPAVVQTRWPALTKRIQAVLQRTEEN